MKDGHEAPLPAAELRWRRMFALVDASFCFLAKHRAELSVRNVLRMASSLGGAPFTPSDLRALAALAPDLLVIQSARAAGDLGHQRSREDVFRPASTTPEDQEVVAFPLAPQPSQRASAKRKKLFDAALKTSASSQSNPVASPQVDTEPAAQVEDSVATTSVDGCGSSVLAMLQGMDMYRDQIVHVERRPAREAQYGDLEALRLPPRVRQALATCGVTQLYSHQFEAIQALRRGSNVVLSTSTASGKSFAYNTPMLDTLLEDPSATFLYLFPTKALAQDQLKALRNVLAAANLPQHLAATFDGDTAMKMRSMVIRETHIFLTNPDMLHLTILPQHTQWKIVLAKLRLLVVDEAHMYRGVFGSHVACVFRRLFRLCALYGSNPQVVCCSATIQNPEAHFRRLLPSLPPPEEVATGGEDKRTEEELGPPNLHFFRQRPLRVITTDGAPTGEKLFCIWNPKISSSADTSADNPPSSEIKRLPSGCNQPPTAKISSTASPFGIASKKRKRQESTAQERADAVESTVSTSPIYQSARILARLMEAQVATLLFCRGRKLTELVLMSVHSVLGANSTTKKLLHRVSSYRGGYTREARRRIEQRLFNGELLGVVATNALELGIDVGELDCTIHLGLPSSVASLWQQAGRAGRRQRKGDDKHSVAIIVCFDAPLDQHFAQKRYAAELFRLKPEAVSLNPSNSRILSQHLLCAARETALFSSRSGMNYVDSYVFGSSNPSDSTRDHEKGLSKLPPEVSAVLQPLVEENKLMVCAEVNGGKRYCPHSCMPKKFRTFSLRSICDVAYSVVVSDDYAVHEDVSQRQVLDEIPGDAAFFQIYPTAVYLHQAQEYLITRLDNDQHVAFAQKCPKKLTYFTTCRDFTDLDVVRVQTTTRLGASDDKKESHDSPVLVRVGMVSILTRVIGSTMLEKRTMRVLGTNEFSLPPMQSFGDAVWLEFPTVLRDEVEMGNEASWVAALHGVGHLLTAVVRLFVLCDANDIDTEHYNPFETRSRPNRVTIYERREGGCGLVDEIVKVLPEVIEKAWTIAIECSCPSGCPACFHSADCSEFNYVLDKQGSLKVLEFLYASLQPPPSS